MNHQQFCDTQQVTPGDTGDGLGNGVCPGGVVGLICTSDGVLDFTNRFGTRRQVAIPAASFVNLYGIQRVNSGTTVEAVYLLIDSTQQL